ncbi:MAG: M13 family metallopeptidase [Methanoculleus sp.]|uniref:M13 family metallopeptidase n=3 Tax=Methanoculleus TaxID=45989 RepID=UPI0025F4D896|nr:MULTISPECIES: M13 family metallopeptidase [unclassified Methanoculleus]MCK9317186.1 M13 family metallopeptidase [Methanoculleus sp.]MDD2253757.1 M13 family metallopeptidase [Methanoculleus sp.]MDD3216597.1 M13 family metallopeptidase [Methanoculleus sp.]MDD4314620.1 M13 family metallopeptidase [Methanoculleus sp.]MDD4470998.1 M13 family metallopeptidase [Methanoculleus sp.]
MKHLFVTLLLIASLVAAGCSAPAGTAVPGAVSQAPESEFILNESIHSGDDFYAYVNDAWIAEHPIPPDKQYYAVFTGMRDGVDDDLHALLLNASAAPTQDGDRNTTLIGQFYRSGMDAGTIDQEGLGGLSDLLSAIDAIDSRVGLANATIVLLEEGFGPVYHYWAEVNPENSSEMVPALYQGGLGLPDRDYYFRNDTESLEVQEAYREHIARVLVLAGEPVEEAAADTSTVYAMERALAAAHLSAEENRDPQKTTNIYTLAELEEEFPAIGWGTLATISGSGPVSRMHIYQPGYVEGLNGLLETAPLEDWKIYLRYRLIDQASPYLNASFEEEHFAFYETTLYGVPEMKSRWQRVVNTESELLGDLVGREYVAEYVDPRTREMVSGIFLAIRETFDERITGLAWMSEPTKAAAHEKLAAMGEKIAYPDRWTDYSGLNLSDSYVGNVRAAKAHSLIHGPEGLEQIGGPVDRSVWFIPPQMVNAFYDPTRNEMVFPAGILQPPIFDPDRDPALNYATLGWVIGHEMTHGFDDQGRQYDRDGNLKDWWTEEDAANFNNRTALLVAEYNAFEALPGLYVNGNLTLGENIADLGGLTLAYHAWKKTENPSDDPDADRRFFIGAATLWRANDREDSLRNLVLTDPHSPEKFRVNGVLFNIPEFYEAFPEIGSGDALYRAAGERPSIW